MWRCIYCKLAELVSKLSVTQLSSHLYFPVLNTVLSFVRMIPQKQRDLAVAAHCVLSLLNPRHQNPKSHQHMRNRESVGVERR